MRTAPTPAEVTEFLTSRSPTTGRSAPRHARETIEALQADGFRVVRLGGCAWGPQSVIDLVDDAGVLVQMGHDRASWECAVGGPRAPLVDVTIASDAMTGERRQHKLATRLFGNPDPGDDWGPEIPTLVPRLVAWLRSGDRAPEVLDALAHLDAQSERLERELLNHPDVVKMGDRTDADGWRRFEQWRRGESSVTQQPEQGQPEHDPYAPPAPGYPPAAPYGQAPGYPPTPGYAPPGSYAAGYAPGGYAPGYGQPLRPLPPLAHWGKRVGAQLLDGLMAMPGPILGLILFGTSFQVVDYTEYGREIREPSTAGIIVIVFGYLVGIGFQIWNRWVLQGRTGQSLGKRVLKIRLVSEQTMAPIGAGMAFVRDLCHVVDGFFYVGYLWPLWDAKRQTFADKILGTLVLDG